MFDAIKHITDDNFFFQQDSAQVHCVCNTFWVKMWFLRFPVLQGSAEAQFIWGGIVKRLLIAYLIGNISAKKYIKKSIHVCQSYSKPNVGRFWDTV